MNRRTLFLLSGLTVALAGGRVAMAERLGGSYRGPEDVQSSKETGGSTDTGSTEGPGGTDTSGGTGEGDSGGFGSGGSSGGSSGGESGGGSSGGDSGGGTAPPSSGGGSGGGDIGGGDSGGGSVRSTGGTEKKSSGGGVGGGAGRGKAADSSQDQLMVVSWYFEHNREKLIGAVAEARSRKLRPQKGSVVAVLSAVPRDVRERSDVTVEDRERIFDVLKKNAFAAEDVVRDAAVIALGKVGTPDAVQILRTRLDEEPKWEIKEDILLALGIARTPEAIEALAATLASNRSRLHPYAALGLGLTRDPDRAGPPLVEHFQAGMQRARKAEDDLAASAMALGNLKFEGGLPALLAAARSRTTPDMVKVYVAQALGRYGTDDARKAIESMLDGSEDVGRAAILALGEFPDAGTAKVLAGKEGLGRPDQLGSGFAALSLGRILGNLPESDWKKVPDEIREVALNPQKASIKAQYANLALSFFDGGVDNDVRKKYADELRNGSKLPADVLSSMAMACGVGSVHGLEGALQTIAEGSGFDPKLRGYAALSVGMTGKPGESAAALRSIYAASDNPDVQRGAVLGLGMVGDRRDVPFLLDVIVKTDRSRPFAQYTRGAAVAALGLVRDGESVSKIQDLLRNPDPWVRAYAVAALGYLADKDPWPVLPRIFEHANFRQEFLPLKVAMRTL